MDTHLVVHVWLPGDNLEANRLTLQRYMERLPGTEPGRTSYEIATVEPWDPNG